MSAFVKNPRGPRHFSYEPRFYNPKKEEDLKRRMRVKSLTRPKRRNPLRIIIFMLLLAMASYIYLSMG